MPDSAEQLGEPLPFEEKITLSNWLHRHVGIDSYREFHSSSIRDHAAFWAQVAREIDWFRAFDAPLRAGDYPNVYRWFPGGLINLSYLSLDRHIRGWRRNKLALIWEGEPTDEKGEPLESRRFTYYDLWRLTNRFAYVMKRLGLKRGDRITLYLPMIPELPLVMLAAARLGVVFSQVFSGFSADALATRINDLEASILFTADGSYRRGRKVRLKETADRALGGCPSVERVVVVRRLGDSDVPMTEGRDLWLHELLEEAPKTAYIEPERLESNEPLYVLYTSGTTGKPKGIIHGQGGYAVLLHATMRWVFDIRDEDVFWCTADIGWVTGHSYIVFGPLMSGATSVMYEGAPDYPAPDRWWSIIERYGVSILYTTPTAIRALRRFGDEYVRRHDLSSLRIIHSVGEPINPSAWRWLFETVGGQRCPVGSTWWMTETGGILISHLPGLMLVPLKAGTNGLPIPGIEVEVLDEAGKPVKPGQRGFLVIKNPWPGMPSPPTGMWREPERYSSVYYSRFGFFFTGDYAVKDEDGYIWVAGRADEVLKVAGHRLGTYELESALVTHRDVAEAAVVGVPDEVKGEVPIAYVVPKADAASQGQLSDELKMWVKQTVGPIAQPRHVFIVSKLPKTRSGKIMRRLLRAIAMNQPLGDITTLEDEAAVEEVKEAYESFIREVREARR